MRNYFVRFGFLYYIIRIIDNLSSHIVLLLALLFYIVGLQREQAFQFYSVSQTDAVHARLPDSHVRDEDLHAGYHLGYQLLRPVGVSSNPFSQSQECNVLACP